MQFAGDIRGAVWKKSSRSTGLGPSNCAEVAILDTEVALRDSKDPEGPALVFTKSEWVAFIGGAKDGEFDL